MRNVIKALLMFSLVSSPYSVWASAFEEHTSYQKEPVLETEKGVSVGRAVMEIGTGFRFLDGTGFFNSSGNIQKTKTDNYNYQYQVMTWDLFLRYGFTENWTFWGNIPLVWSDQEGAVRARSAAGDIGDCDVGVLYQFYKSSDPTLSMGLSLRWKMPTGAENPGKLNKNITGTGLTDVDASFIGRFQIIRNLSLGWGVGYNVRFPGSVQYITDQNTSITNARVDLGDEMYGQVDFTGAIDWLAVQLLVQFKYRVPTQIALATFTADTMRWNVPADKDSTGKATQVSDTFVVFNGYSYRNWNVHQQLDPTKAETSSAGYLVTIMPKIIIRPLDWVDVTLFTKLYPSGKNSIYVTDKNNNNRSFNNFMPMQTLGMQAGGMIVGEVGGTVTVRW